MFYSLIINFGRHQTDEHATFGVKKKVLTISFPKIGRINRKKRTATKSRLKRIPTPKRVVVKMGVLIQTRRRKIHLIVAVQMIPRSIGRRVGLDRFDPITITTVTTTAVVAVVPISAKRWRQQDCSFSLRTCWWDLTRRDHRHHHHRRRRRRRRHRMRSRRGKYRGEIFATTYLRLVKSKKSS